MDYTESVAMTRSKRNRLWLQALLAAASVLMVAPLVACTGQVSEAPGPRAISELLTLEPEKAATLTAWPTPPPIFTLPPTPSAAPQALWTAEPEEGLVKTDVPVPTDAPPVPSPESTGQSAQVNAAVLGTLARPTQFLIPAIGLEVPIVEVSWRVTLEDGEWHSRWQTVDEAAGHHRNSANPGELGNVVLSGHHNAGTEVFREVSEIGSPDSSLGEGTELILVAADGSQYSYRVVSWERFQVEGIPDTQRLSYARYMEPSTDAILTLITCWPYEGRSHRVVVVAALQSSE